MPAPRGPRLLLLLLQTLTRCISAMLLLRLMLRLSAVAPGSPMVLLLVRLVHAAPEEGLPGNSFAHIAMAQGLCMAAGAAEPWGTSAAGEASPGGQPRGLGPDIWNEAYQAVPGGIATAAAWCCVVALCSCTGEVQWDPEGVLGVPAPDGLPPAVALLVPAGGLGQPGIRCRDRAGAWRLTAYLRPAQVLLHARLLWAVLWQISLQGAVHLRLLCGWLLYTGRLARCAGLQAVPL